MLQQVVPHTRRVFLHEPPAGLYHLRELRMDACLLNRGQLLLITAKILIER